MFVLTLTYILTARFC